MNTEILSDITVHMKYAKYNPELLRRETWNEIVERNKSMHMKTYPNLRRKLKMSMKTSSEPRKSSHPCVLCNLVESLSRLAQIGYTIALICLLIPIYLSLRLCSFCSVERGWDIPSNDIILNNCQKSGIPRLTGSVVILLLILSKGGLML